MSKVAVPLSAPSGPSFFRESDYVMWGCSPEVTGPFSLRPPQHAADLAAEPEAECDHSLSASTVSIPDEPHSPTRRRVAAADATPPAACSSFGVSELECGYSRSEDSPPSIDCAMVGSPTAAARAAPIDGFATPSAWSKTESTGQSQESMPDHTSCQPPDPADARPLAVAEERCQPVTRPPAVDAARLQEVLELQSALQAARAAAAEREQELARRAAALEAERARTQLHADGLRAQLQGLRQQLADSDALVQEQAQVISQMERQLRQGTPTSSGGAASSDASGRQEADNAALRKALHALHLQLADRAARPVPQEQVGSGGGEAGEVQDLRVKLGKAEGLLRLREEQHRLHIQRLQHEHGQRRVQEHIRAAGRLGAARVRDLEQQVQQAEEAAARKLRIMQSRLKEAEARLERERMRTGGPADSSKAGGCGGSKPPPLAPLRAAGGPAAAKAAKEALLSAGVQLRQKENRVRRLEGEARKRDAELESLRRRADQAERQAHAAGERQQQAEAEAAALRQAVAEVTAANEGLQAQVQQVAALKRELAAAQEAVAGLRKRCASLAEAERTVAALQRQQSDAAEQLASTQAQHAAELRCVRRDQEQGLRLAWQAGQEAAAAGWGPQVAEAQRSAAEWRGRAEQLEGDLRAARSGLPWAPSAGDFAALERRMLECEQRAQQREAHWRAVAEERGRAAAAAARQVRGRLEEQGQRGGADDIRCQLDGLLAAAQLVQGAAVGR